MPRRSDGPDLFSAPDQLRDSVARPKRLRRRRTGTSLTLRFASLLAPDLRFPRLRLLGKLRRRTCASDRTWAVRAAQAIRTVVEPRIVCGEFFNLDKLVLAHVRKCLRRRIPRPPYFDLLYLRGLAQSDVLPQRRASERALAADCGIDRPRPHSFVFHRHLDARADSGPVRLDAHQAHDDPVVRIAGIFKKAKGMTVAGHGAADGSENVQVAVVVQVGHGHAMPFMQLAGARRSRDIDEGPSFLVPQQDVGDQRAVRGAPRSQIDVRISIVVQIAKVAAHGHENLVQSGLLGYIAERAVSQILI